MKVLSINYNNYNIPNTKYKKMNNHLLTNDYFIKSKTPAFNGTQTFVQNFEPFKKDLTIYLKNNKTIELSRISSIIQKFRPFLKIKDFSEIPNNTNIHDMTGAYYRDEILFNYNGEITNGEKELYINPPQPNSKEDTITFIELLVHEMTHVFQESSSDRISKFDYINNFLKKTDLNVSKFQILQLMPKLYSMVEYNYVLPLICTLNSSNEYPREIRLEPSEELLDNIYLQQTGLKIQDYLNLIIDKSLETLGKPNSKESVNILIEYLQLIADKEREAYKNGLDYIKEFLNIKYPTDLDLKVKLYDMLCNNLNSYKIH